MLGCGNKLSWRNTSDLVYRTLRERGYEQDNLFVLGGEEYPTEGFDCHTLPSSKKYLQEVLNHLYRNVASDDVFFMYVLSHGSKTRLILPIGQSTFLLNNETVREEEIEELLSDIHPDHSVTYFNSCYSGGLARRLGKGKNIAISTTRGDKITSGYVGQAVNKQQGLYASNFTLNFFSALRGELPNGDRIDINDDSIEGVFDFASEVSYQNDKYLGPLSKNTPHLIYGRINPKEVRL
ncbi:MAG: C13 family peptidase [Candidatus Aenigmarchaeota archaeon]|nr:C13 family peptidase [Candidatus Aenigmarchaeota archaeon]